LLRSINYENKAPLRNLCQALENDPGVSTYITELELLDLSYDLLAESLPSIPTPSRLLFLSFLSFIPEMHNLRRLCFDKMWFRDDTRINFCSDFSVLEESSVTHLTLINCDFSISALNVFLGHWRDMGLTDICFDGISLIPYNSQTSPVFEETIYDWDEEDTWRHWAVKELELTFSETLGCGIFMLMDLLASKEWSPFIDLDYLRINAGESDAMTVASVTRINNLISRYNPSALWLHQFTDFEIVIDTPLNFGGIESVKMELNVCNDFTIVGLDEDHFEWYLKSLAAVPRDSRLREISLLLHILVPLEAKDLGSQGVLGRLDSALCGDNIQLEKLDIYISPTSTPSDSKTCGVKEISRWLMGTCLPTITTRHRKNNTLTLERLNGNPEESIIFMDI
ncbi:hypothetical protein CPB85DRAFT_1370144, partial [Mucidula mucida]